MSKIKAKHEKNEKKFIKYFPEQADAKLINAFSCTLSLDQKRSQKYKGKMFVTKQAIFHYSDHLRKKEKVIIDISQITNISKLKDEGIIRDHEEIEISTKDNTYYFSAFSDIEKVLFVIEPLWASKRSNSEADSVRISSQSSIKQKEASESSSATSSKMKSFLLRPINSALHRTDSAKKHFVSNEDSANDGPAQAKISRSLSQRDHRKHSGTHSSKSEILFPLAASRHSSKKKKESSTAIEEVSESEVSSSSSSKKEKSSHKHHHHHHKRHSHRSDTVTEDTGSDQAVASEASPSDSMSVPPLSTNASPTVSTSPPSADTPFSLRSNTPPIVMVNGQRSDEPKSPAAIDAEEWEAEGADQQQQQQHHIYADKKSESDEPTISISITDHSQENDVELDSDLPTLRSSIEKAMSSVSSSSPALEAKSTGSIGSPSKRVNIAKKQHSARKFLSLRREKARNEETADKSTRSHISSTSVEYADSPSSEHRHNPAALLRSKLDHVKQRAHKKHSVSVLNTSSNANREGFSSTSDNSQDQPLPLGRSQSFSSWGELVKDDSTPPMSELGLLAPSDHSKPSRHLASSSRPKIGSKIRKLLDETIESSGDWCKDSIGTTIRMLDQVKKPLSERKGAITIGQDRELTEGSSTLPTGALFKVRIHIIQGKCLGSFGGFCRVQLADVSGVRAFYKASSKKVKMDNPEWDETFDCYLFDDRCFILTISCKTTVDVMIGSSTVAINNMSKFSDFCEWVPLFDQKNNEYPRCLVQIGIRCTKVEKIDYAFRSFAQQDCTELNKPNNNSNNNDNNNNDNNSGVGSNSNTSLSGGGYSSLTASGNHLNTIRGEIQTPNGEITSSPKLTAAVKINLRCSEIDVAAEPSSPRIRRRMDPDKVNKPSTSSSNRGISLRSSSKKVRQQRKQVSAGSQLAKRAEYYYQSSVPPEMTLNTNTGDNVTIPFMFPGPIVNLHNYKFDPKNNRDMVNDASVRPLQLTNVSVKKNPQTEYEHVFLLPEDKQSLVTIPFPIMEKPCFVPQKIELAQRYRFSKFGHDMASSDPDIDTDGLTDLEIDGMADGDVSIPNNEGTTINGGQNDLNEGDPFETREEVKARLYEENVLKRKIFIEAESLQSEIFESCVMLGLAHKNRNKQLLCKTTTYNEWGKWRADFNSRIDEALTRLDTDVEMVEALHNPIHESWKYCREKFGITEEFDPKQEVAEPINKSIKISKERIKHMEDHSPLGETEMLDFKDIDPAEHTHKTTDDLKREVQKLEEIQQQIPNQEYIIDRRYLAIGGAILLILIILYYIS